MSQTTSTPSQRMVSELKVSAHLMMLDPGVFCLFHSPGTQPPDPVTGLPGVRVSRPPATAPEMLSISTFSPDGWLGGDNNAALIRVNRVPAQVLVTIYQAAGSAQEAPKLQVLRLSEQPAASASPQASGQAPVRANPNAALSGGAAPGSEPAPPPAAGAAEKPEVAAHVQRRGDLLARIGDWMGERGSQNWIEGFAILPSHDVDPADIEYQAVLGKGWLSPWSEGGKYCGSRGMALPILGLRVRLKGDAAGKFDLRLQASFTDGTLIGPVDGSQTAEAPSLAPLEAFRLEILPHDMDQTGEAAPSGTARSEATKPVHAKAADARSGKPTPKSPRLPPVKPAIQPLRSAPAQTGVQPGVQPPAHKPANAPGKTAVRTPARTLAKTPAKTPAKTTGRK